jgi:DNA mismatch repair protein MutS
MTNVIEKELSPMMQQWHSCKAKANDALLLFRLGDFYEAFHEDAETLAIELDLTLTKRGPTPMSGIPSQTLDFYVEKLIEKGFIVAIAEQIESSKESKTLVRREITKIISPGAHQLTNTLVDSKNNFIASAAQVNQSLGLVFLDLSTSTLIALELDNKNELIDEVAKRSPKELILSEKFYKANTEIFDEIKSLLNLRLHLKPEWKFSHDITYNYLTKHFKVHSLDGFGLKGMISVINSLGALLNHVEVDLCQNIDFIQGILIESPSNFMQISYTTAKHLDLIQSSTSMKDACLYQTLNKTSTAMGSRLLKEWILHPLLNISEIKKRQDGVEELVTSPLYLSEILSSIKDLERLATRVSTKIANPRDLLALSNSLQAIPLLKNSLSSFKALIFKEELENFFDFSEIAKKIKIAIQPEAPTKIHEGGIFNFGYSAELDELKTLKEQSETWLANYQAHLRDSLDMKTLKVGYSKAFGYFIEASRLQSQKMPSNFEKRQTLVNGERFISPELKEYEHKILTAEEKMWELEKELFLALREEVSMYLSKIQKASKSIAIIDTLNALGSIASDRGYVKPEIVNTEVIEIVDGKHPILESFFKTSSFIPNDTFLNAEKQSLVLITGPNMAGKSTYLRQVALIVILAQIGSFVPARSLRLGIIDKVFSRIGASDDLARGQSTFMVEMAETASILNTATKNSLVILDEIGRGTSTYDGIAIATSVAEHLIKIGAKTLFATHFWELTRLENDYKQVKNFRVAVGENEDGILFLHKILPGGADKSYGIHVAKLAGLPSDVIKRAQKLLTDLEEKKWQRKKPEPKEEQFLLFAVPQMDELSFKIKSLDLNKTTPIEALQFLIKLQNEI